MRRPPAIFATLILSLSFLAAAEADDRVVFEEPFEEPNALSAWQGDAGKIVRDGDSNFLRISNDNADSAVTLRRTIPAEKLAGSLITIRARVKGKDVSTPPRHYHGVKVMLILQIGEGLDYPQVPMPSGTFDWKGFERTMRLPSDIRGAQLVLGLEKSSGTVEFDDIEILLGRPVDGPFRRGDRFKGHDLDRLRGVMHGPNFEERNIADLAEWKANQVRWQLNWVPMKPAEQWAANVDDYNEWLDGALEQADRAIDSCEEHGIALLLDLHCPPGGRMEGGVCRMLTEKKYQDLFLDCWRKIATRYKGRDIIYAYDLVNEICEPPVYPDGVMTWPELATEATRIIREIDPGKPVVYEPGPWGSCNGFDRQKPLDLDRVIYSFHMYQPHAFTHQMQLEDKYPDGLVYPGMIDGVMWDKERLRESMLPAIDFQNEFNVHMYVGEFSAIRWAPDGSAHRYLKDCIDLFEEYGWDWSYHAYREWPGWSVEHTTDKNDWEKSLTPTPRELLLKEWFSKNEPIAR